ncbi:hypothetical protein GALMADRAFT_773749 [Galerina marginata CBS 339.88]|uniref:Uncharacterized protein n=1 Tax=Galerina marginata (strain CBS 339.88) TaxID=685588 RepID=A0A067SZ50_GALM3|nr:hypothetical protein GALMADRAFT_773749 [Galerina marginata CBS 339.88]
MIIGAKMSLNRPNTKPQGSKSHYEGSRGEDCRSERVILSVSIVMDSGRHADDGGEFFVRTFS